MQLDEAIVMEIEKARSSTLKEVLEIIDGEIAKIEDYRSMLRIHENSQYILLQIEGCFAKITTLENIKTKITALGGK